MIEFAHEYYREKRNGIIKYNENWAQNRVEQLASQNERRRWLLLRSQQLALICVAALPFLLLSSDFVSKYVSIGISSIPVIVEVMTKVSGIRKRFTIYSYIISELKMEIHCYELRLENYQDKKDGERADALRDRVFRIIHKVERDGQELDKELAKEMELELSKQNKN